MTITGPRVVKKRDFPVEQIRRYLEPGPIVLVSSHWRVTGMSEGGGELPEEMSAEVDRALKAPGAYYSVGREKGDIVIPRLGWASLSFFG